MSCSVTERTQRPGGGEQFNRGRGCHCCPRIGCSAETHAVSALNSAFFNRFASPPSALPSAGYLQRPSTSTGRTSRASGPPRAASIPRDVPLFRNSALLFITCPLVQRTRELQSQVSPALLNSRSAQRGAQPSLELCLYTGPRTTSVYAHRTEDAHMQPVVAPSAMNRRSLLLRFALGLTRVNAMVPCHWRG